MNNQQRYLTNSEISDEEVEEFRSSGMFDQEWYLQQYPDVASTQIDPARHYLWIGRVLGRSPSPHSSAGAGIARPVGQPFGTPALYEEAWRDAYAVALGARSPNFAPAAGTRLVKSADAPKVVAFYLPQFHPIKENDAWWGKGFTEWTNVTKAVPQYKGHHQPRLPLDLGFYDLRNPDVMSAQVELAKINGVDAFCFHYYWFDGHRLLETPLEAYLENESGELDLPFCICWANENWTRRWDGSETDLLMEQNHSREDHARVFDDLLRYLRDPRYLKVNGEPIIVIYRPSIIKDLEAMVSIWREAAHRAGLKGIHLVATNSFGFSDPGSINFDGLCEFPPHNVVVGAKNSEKKWYNPQHEGYVYHYDEVVQFCEDRLNGLDGESGVSNYYPTLMMGWDNEARKPGRGNIFDGCTPALFRRWLDTAVTFSSRNHYPDGRLVFVNAWNEWAEGTYLEPDRSFGHAYLWAIRSVFEERLGADPEVARLVAEANASAGSRASDGAICLHLFYPDLIDELAAQLTPLTSGVDALDLLLTLPFTWHAADVDRALRAFRPKLTVITPNRGRDVLPFIKLGREARKMGYTYGCKIHSKKSPHIAGGTKWRSSIYSSLLAPNHVVAAQQMFRSDPICGLYAPDGMIKTCGDPSTMRDNLANLSRLLEVTGASIGHLERFVAGTMFWFRFDAMRIAFDDRFDQDWFGPELGAIDGTMAHAFERATVHLCEKAGFRLLTYPAAVQDPYS